MGECGEKAAEDRLLFGLAKRAVGDPPWEKSRLDGPRRRGVVGRLVMKTLGVQIF